MRLQFLSRRLAGIDDGPPDASFYLEQRVFASRVLDHERVLVERVVRIAVPAEWRDVPVPPRLLESPELFAVPDVL